MNSPVVSVIVPVYQHAAELRSCLAALEKQTYADGHEVVVVDNGENGDLSALVREHPHATLTFESTASSYAARNRGLTRARGEVLAFTDADCIPAQDWLARGVARLLDSPDCGIVGGRIRFVFRDPARPSAVEFFDSRTFLRQEFLMLRKHYASTANLFTRRSVFDRVGTFDPRRTSGGDGDFGRRVFAAGLALVYADDACVDHPARTSLRALYRKVVRLAGSDFYQWRGPHLRRAFWADLAKNLAAPVVGVRIALAHTQGQSRRRTLEFYALWIFCRCARQYKLVRLLCGGALQR